jgi:hypothetical protein
MAALLAPLRDADNYPSVRLVLEEGEVVDRVALPTRPLLTAPRADSLDSVGPRGEARRAAD